MAAKARKRKMGRPPLPPAERKLASMGFRPTPETRRSLEKAAARSGRSKSQEIESRLERSLSDQDARAAERAAEFGGKAIYDFMKKLARVAGIVGLKTGADFGNDAYTRAEAISAMVEVLKAYRIEAAGVAAEQGRGFAGGGDAKGSLGKNIAEGPGAEIGREIARLVLGIDPEPNQHTRKKRR